MSFILQTSIVVRRLTTPITCQKSHNVRSYSLLLQSRQFQKISTSASYQNISECFINSIKSEEVNAICVVFVVSSQFSMKGMGKCVQCDWKPQSLICVIMSVNPRRRCVQCRQMGVDRRRVLFLAFRLISSTPSDSSCSASWDTFSQKRSLEWARLFPTALGDIQRGKIPKIKAALTFCSVITRRSGCHSKYPLDMISTASLRKWECPLLDLSLVFSVTPAMWTLWV